MADSARVPGERNDARALIEREMESCRIALRGFAALAAAGSRSQDEQRVAARTEREYETWSWLLAALSSRSVGLQEGAPASPVRASEGEPSDTELLNALLRRFKCQGIQRTDGSWHHLFTITLDVDVAANEARAAIAEWIAAGEPTPFAKQLRDECVWCNGTGVLEDHSSLDAGGYPRTSDCPCGDGTLIGAFDHLTRQRSSDRDRAGDSDTMIVDEDYLRDVLKELCERAYPEHADEEGGVAEMVGDYVAAMRPKFGSLTPSSAARESAPEEHGS